MSQFLDKLNLRPQEKRLVVLGSVVLFVVLNFWFVWPHASDLQQVRARLDQSRHELRTYQIEVSRTNEYHLRLQELQTQAAILPEEQSTALISEIQSQAIKSGVNFGQVQPLPRSATAKPTDFFEEKSLRVDVNPTGPAELLNFLLALASSDLAIRVKELDLKPDPSQTKLTGSMRLVASFRQKPAEGNAVTPAPTATGRRS